MRRYLKEHDVSNPLPPSSLTGKRVLVTGSSRGVGADTVAYFAEGGGSRVINFRQNGPRSTKLADKLRAGGATAITVGADLTDAGSVAKLFETIREQLGGLDILVLNASGGMEGGMAADYAVT